MNHVSSHLLCLVPPFTCIHIHFNSTSNKSETVELSLGKCSLDLAGVTADTRGSSAHFTSPDGKDCADIGLVLFCPQRHLKTAGI